jgi:hypothetical protein
MKTLAKSLSDCYLKKVGVASGRAYCSSCSGETAQRETKMNNIYTDAKGNNFRSIKAALYVARELNATAEGGMWTHEIDKDNNIYLWFQEFAPAKVGA